MRRNWCRLWLIIVVRNRRCRHSHILLKCNSFVLWSMCLSIKPFTLTNMDMFWTLYCIIPFSMYYQYQCKPQLCQVTKNSIQNMTKEKITCVRHETVKRGWTFCVIYIDVIYGRKKNYKWSPLNSKTCNSNSSYLS